MTVIDLLSGLLTVCILTIVGLLLRLRQYKAMLRHQEHYMGLFRRTMRQMLHERS